MAENKISPLDGIFVLGSLYLASKVFGAFGDLGKSAREAGKDVRKAGEAVIESIDAIQRIKEFSAGYKFASGAKLFKQIIVNKLVEDLVKVKGLFNDNEEMLWSVLNKIVYRSQLAQVAQFFRNKTNKDLGAYLVSFTNTNERRRIIEWYNNLQ